MRILLTTLNSKYVHSNLALRYLKACLEQDCLCCETYLKEYTINDNMSGILASVFKAKADVYAFSCYIWNIEQTMEVCENLKKVNPSVVIILGGPEVSYDSAEIMKNKPFIDFIISGEGEKSIPQLVSTIINRNENYEAIEGLYYRDSEGRIKDNFEPCLIQDLSEIPSPFQNDLSEYNDKAAYYESSRGCPYNCSYCLSSTIKGVRYFPMDRVKSDLKNLIDSGAKQVKFVDRTFNCSSERALEIWKFIIGNNKNTIFHFEIGAHLIDDEMLDFLKQIPEGMFEFEIGIQSTNNAAITEVGRITDFEKINSVVNSLSKMNNIHTHLDLIAGLPFEDYKSFGKSFDDVYALKPHMLQLGFLKLLKGSKIRNEHKKHEYIFVSKPPYEVLANKYISYNEIIQLKQIEEMLEIYKNSGRFENSLEYLNKIYSSPFKLFENLSTFWQERNNHSRKISQEENYDILFEFYKKVINSNIEEFREVLKLDFLLNNFGAKKRLWQRKYVFSNMKATVKEILNSNDFILEYCPQIADAGISERIKKIHFELFKVNKNNYYLIMIEKKHESRGIIKTGYKTIDIKYYKEQSIEEIV